MTTNENQISLLSQSEGIIIENIIYMKNILQSAIALTLLNDNHFQIENDYSF